MKTAAAIVALAVCRLFGADITNVSVWAGASSLERTCEKGGDASFAECSVFVGDGPNSGFGSASAKASPGYVSISIGAVANGMGAGSAEAFARDSSSYLISGSGSIDVTGLYFRSAGPCFSCSDIEISQNGTTAQDISSFSHLTTIIQRGIPFDVVLQLSASLDAGGQLNASILDDEMVFKGFIDDHGDPLPYSRLPEPGTFWPLGVAFTGIVIARKRRSSESRSRTQTACA